MSKRLHVAFSLVFIVTLAGNCFTVVDALGTDGPYAYSPVPADGNSLLISDPNLSWQPGAFATSHNVYFGTDFAEVNDAMPAAGDVNFDGEVDMDDLGVLTAQWLTDPGSSNPSADIDGDGTVNAEDFAMLAEDWKRPTSYKGNQAGTEYTPSETLVLGQTYYWRIDEVNDSNVWKGDVWSFIAALPPGLYDPVWECGSFILEFNPTTGVVSSLYKKNDSQELITQSPGGGFVVYDLDGPDVYLYNVHKTEIGALYAANAAETYSVTMKVTSSPDANYMKFHITDLVGFPTSENAKLRLILPFWNANWTQANGIVSWYYNGDAIGLMPADYMTQVLGGTRMTVDWNYLWSRDTEPVGNFVLFVCDEDDILANIGTIETDVGIPHPLYNDNWAKIDNQVAYQSSLSLGFTNPVDRDKAVDYCRQSGLGMMYLAENTWEGSSVNTINTSNFPSGKPDLLKFSQDLRKENILLGIHTASCNLRQNDTSYVAPTPDSRLASWGAGTLGSGINESATSIAMTPDPGTVIPTCSGPDIGKRPPEYGVGWTYNYIRIDNEIIKVGTFWQNTTWFLLNCTRGYFGTTAASHSGGAEITGLLSVCGSMAVDASNSLFQEIADRLSDVVNECEISFISLDALEAAAGPCPWGREKFVKLTYDGFDHFVSLDSSSGITPYQWNMASLWNNGENMHVYPKPYFDSYVVGKGGVNNFLPEGMGCYTLRTDSRVGAWHASTTDEFEWWLAKCVAYDGIFFLETSVDDLDNNGETDEILELVKKWDLARLNDVFSPSQKTDMLDFYTTFRMTDTDPNSKTWSVTPVKIMPFFVEPDSSVSVNNVYTAQGLQFEVQVLPQYDYSSASNINLLPAGTGDLSIDSGLSVVKDGNEWTFSMTNSGGSPSVALQGNDTISTTDLSNKRGIGLYFTGDGNGGYFLIEYKCSDGRYRQYIVPNDSSTKKYVEIPSTEVCDYLYRDTLYDYFQNTWYAIRQAFNFTQIDRVSFGLVGVPAGTSVSVVVEGIRALAETATTMDDLTMTTDGTTLTVDGSVASGNYLVYEGGGTASVLDADRHFVEYLDVDDIGWQKNAGESGVTVNCSGAVKPWLKVLFKTIGTSSSFSNPNFYATNPSPAYGTTNVDPNDVVLSWEASIYAADVNGHDVYLGTSYSAVAGADHGSGEYVGVYDTNTCTPGFNLDANTTYYWSVDEVNGVDVYIGDIWMFKTFDTPGKATVPSPSNGATGASCGASLSWTADDSATSQDVYFGTVEADVNDANTEDSEFKINQPGTTYAPGPMSETTTYYWRIDEKNSIATTKGDIWSFTTGTGPSSIGWTSSGSSLWSDTHSWNPVDVPGSTSSVYISNNGSPQPSVDSTVAAYGATTRVGGTGLSNSVTMTGGTWTTSNHLILGEAGGSTATVNISDGSISVYSLWVGNNGQGIVNMTGGTITQTQAGENLYISTFANKTGNQFNLDAGTVNVQNINMGAGTLDIHAGTLIIDGDKTPTISSYVTSGYIIAYDGSGTVVWDYNTSNAGKTTVTAIP